MNLLNVAMLVMRLGREVGRISNVEFWTMSAHENGLERVDATCVLAMKASHNLTLKFFNSVFQSYFICVA